MVATMQMTTPAPLANRRNRSWIARGAEVIVLASIAGATLTGCSVVSDVVAGQVSGAACSAGSGVAERVATDVTTAIGDIAVAPAAALATLKAAEDALGVGVLGITAEPAASAVADAKSTLGELVVIAQDATTGVPVDQDTLLEQFTVDLAGVC